MENHSTSKIFKGKKRAVAEQDLTELTWKQVNFSLCHECLILPFLGYKSLSLHSKLSNLRQVFSTCVVWTVMVPSLRVFPLKTSGPHKSYIKYWIPFRKFLFLRTLRAICLSISLQHFQRCKISLFFLRGSVSLNTQSVAMLWHAVDVKSLHTPFKKAGLWCKKKKLNPDKSRHNLFIHYCKLWKLNCKTIKNYFRGKKLANQKTTITWLHK